VNPWKLMLWTDHKRIDETMLYVHFAEAHLRPLPEVIVQAQRGHDDEPDGRVIAMLGARRLVGRGSHVAAAGLSEEEVILFS
jgi:hypothetical protein